MTIPSRPAPAPPGARGQSAAAGANASIEQLRLQLQQQHLQQQQNGGIQKMTFNIPPPPRRPSSTTPLTNSNRNNSNFTNNNYSTNFSMDSNNQTSITRKFPQARYTPTTNWDDNPFGGSTIMNNGTNMMKKVPPPRPPPPKVQVPAMHEMNGRKAPQPPTHSTKLLNNLFRLKKSSSSSNNSSNNNNNKANKIYGLSSGACNSSKTIKTTKATNRSSSSTTTNSASLNSSNMNAWATTTTTNHSSSSNSWQANWNSSYTSTSLTSLAANGATSNNTTSNSSGVAEAQLISFDSPPSSPTFTQKSNSDCLSVDSFSSDSNFSSPNNGSVSQPESGFEDDFSARSRPATTSPLDPWEAFVGDSGFNTTVVENIYGTTGAASFSSNSIGTAPVRNLNTINTRIHSSNDNPLCNGKSLLPPTPALSAPTIIKPKVSQKSRAPKPPVLPKPSQFRVDYSGGSDTPPTPPSPPMPLCAPPPPPPSSSSTTNGVGGVSLLDVISGKADALQLSGASSFGSGFGSGVEESRPYGIALYDFDGIEEGDLSFRENEKIYILERVSAEWYRGRTRSGCEGIFPINYIDVKVPLAEEAPTLSSNQAQQATKSGKPIIVRCLYDFPAEYDGDLALKENEMVTILYRINEDWLYGEVDNRQGQFPANFLEYLPDNIPTA